MPIRGIVLVSVVWSLQLTDRMTDECMSTSC